MSSIPILDRAIKRLMEIDQASVFALADVAEERVRQIEREGWTADHDDAHASGEMATAGACYALHPKGNNTLWPWAATWWKPKSPHRNYVRAGALIVAELAKQLRRSS